MACVDQLLLTNQDAPSLLLNAEHQHFHSLKLQTKSHSNKASNV